MTVFPLLLGLYDSTESDKQRIPILEDLESFLVRRMVCRLTTQGYNRLFLDLVSDLEERGQYSQQGVQQYLLAQTADSNRWPDDNEFKDAWMGQPLYTGITRPRLRILLRALDAALHTSKTEPYSLKGALTVEHLLPQHWEKHWPLPKVEGEDPAEFAERKRLRNLLLHTIGNLTMLTESLNPVVSNGPFAQKKKQILSHSAINLNRVLAEEDGWDESRILARGQKLFELARKLWPYPATDKLNAAGGRRSPA